MLTRAELIARASAIVPHLAARAAEAEAQRRVPEASLAEIEAAGLLRILQPQRTGGLELDLAALSEAVRALAHGCPSTAWVLAHLAAHRWLLAMWPQDGQDEVWSVSADPRIAAALTFPAGRAERAGAGYRLSGHWGFASGIDACDWVILGAVAAVGDDPEAGEYRLFLVPRSDYRIADTWFAAGLSATGSKEVHVDAAEVPERRSVGLRELQAGRAPGAKIHPGPLYRIPPVGAFGYLLAGVLLGIAERAAEHFTSEARTRMTASDGRKFGDFDAVQVKLAEATAHIDAARRTLAEGCAAISRVAESGQVPGLAEKARLRRDCAYSCRQLCAAVDLLFQASGGAALLVGHPALRAFLDAHAAVAHIALNWDAAASLYGRVALGLTGELPPHER